MSGWRSGLWWVILLGCAGSGTTSGPEVPGDGMPGDPGRDGDPGWQQDLSDAGGVADGHDSGVSETLVVDEGPQDSEPGEVREDVEEPGPGDVAPGEASLGDEGETEDPGWDASADPGPGEDLDRPEDLGTGDPGTQDVGPGPFTVQVRPALPEDVVASYLMSLDPTAWNLFGGDALPLGRHFGVELGHVGYHSALRFPGLAIPPGARIRSATLSFLPTNEVDSSNILWLSIHAERSADSAPLSLTDYDRGRPDQRLLTEAAIDQWVIRCNASCTDLTEYDCPQRKRDCWDRTVRYQCPKDLKALVQEVVDLPGWRSGNALTLILEPNVPIDYQDRDTGARHIVGVDAGRPDTDRPLLEVTWEWP